MKSKLSISLPLWLLLLMQFVSTCNASFCDPNSLVRPQFFDVSRAYLYDSGKRADSTRLWKVVFHSLQNMPVTSGYAFVLCAIQ